MFAGQCINSDLAIDIVYNKSVFVITSNNFLLFKDEMMMLTRPRLNDDEPESEMELWWVGDNNFTFCAASAELYGPKHFRFVLL